MRPSAALRPARGALCFPFQVLSLEAPGAEKLGMALEKDITKWDRDSASMRSSRRSEAGQLLRTVASPFLPRPAREEKYMWPR
jgi:hypothetical protein